MVWSHSFGAFDPIHGANFSVLLEVLKSVDDVDHFPDGAAKWHVVDGLVTDDTALVDEEESTVSDQFALGLEVSGVSLNLLRQNVVDDFSVDVREAEVATGVAVGKFFVIES